jgi:hypothetical protein
MRQPVWSVPREWAGETAYLLGGGPSLANIDVRSLPGRTIAINNSWAIRPDADVLYFCDAAWWQTHGDAVKAGFRGKYISSIGDIHDEMVKRLRNGGPTGLDLRPEYLRHGANSGYQAINLAVHFGASRIILLGYDMKTDGNKTHWHEGHGVDPAIVQHGIEKRMLPQFGALVEPLKAAGVEIVNATEGSALKCFPMRVLSEIEAA